MPSFLYPLPIAVAAGLVSLPIIIHLINLMRHRKIRWAAMEFLLESQKRNRTWVMLKQLLLLLLRIAAIAAAVLIVAQPILQNKLGALFGGSKLHHIVLLDDSYSMSDHWADTSAFDEAKALILRLASQAAQQPGRQEFTLLRFSQAGQAGGTHADISRRTIDPEFQKYVEQALAAIHVSQLAVGPAEALKAASQMIGDKGEASNVVYLVSDYRAKDWTSATALRKELQKLNDQGAQIQTIDCVDTAHANLGIVSLRPVGGTRAVGVPLQMEITVRNYGPTPVSNLSIRLEEQGVPRPAIEIDKIEPGRSVTRQFEIRALNAGERQVTAYLPADAILADNVRHAVVDFPNGVPVLIIDGATRASAARTGDGYFLESAMLQPGPVPTGLRPRVEAPRFLEEHALDDFHAIYLCNIERLPQSVVEKLTKYVENGGGLAFFTGDQSRADFLNQLYADGEGLFPAPLESPIPLLVDQMAKSPDLIVGDHPIFHVFAGENNPFIRMVNIEKYFAVQKNWKPQEGSSTKILARLRNGAPLAIEKKIGAGHVVAFLTTAAPQWNNWARDNPSYVITMLELESYLSSTRQADLSRLVGTPLEIPVDTQKYSEQVQFVTPAEGTADRIVIKAEPIQGSSPIAKFDNTATSGVYEVVLTQSDNTESLLAFAYNVDPAEGDLAIVSEQQLAAELPDVAYEFHRAADLYFDSKELQGFNLSENILYLLVFLLIGEQLLAYSASYHPARAAGAT